MSGLSCIALKMLHNLISFSIYYNSLFVIISVLNILQFYYIQPSFSPHWYGGGEIVDGIASWPLHGI